MTKIDLDEIERKAKAATPGPWRVGSSDPADYRAVLHEVDGDVYEIAIDVSPEDAQHLAANSPPVTLALIARIRELETLLTTESDALDNYVGENVDEREDLEAMQKRMRRVLERGAVLP